MEEYLTREADMGGIAVMMALINDIIKAYEESALQKKIQEEGIWKFEINNMLSPIAESRWEWSTSLCAGRKW